MIFPSVLIDFVVYWLTSRVTPCNRLVVVEMKNYFGTSLIMQSERV